MESRKYGTLTRSRSVYRLLTMPPKALLLACSDNKFPFGEHSDKDLGLPEGYCFPIRVPGGPIPLVYKDEVPDYHYKSLLAHIRFALDKRPTITEIVVICHEDCGFVKEFLPDYLHKGKEDLQRIAAELRRLFPHIKTIKLFYAAIIKVNEGHKVDFQRVQEEVLQAA